MVEPVNLVDEETVPFVQVGQHPGEVARFFQHGTRCHLEFGAQLFRYDMRQSSLTETGRSEEETMIQGFAAVFSGGDEDPKVLLQFGLPDEFFEARGTQRFIEFRFIFQKRGIGKIVGIQGLIY